jgi:hypothetical protein
MPLPYTKFEHWRCLGISPRQAEGVGKNPRRRGPSRSPTRRHGPSGKDPLPFFPFWARKPKLPSPGAPWGELSPVTPPPSTPPPCPWSNPSRPLSCERLILDQLKLIRYGWSGHRSSSRRPGFNEPGGRVRKPPWTQSMRLWTDSIRLFIRKIIRKVWRIAGPWKICKNTPELFWNYIFIPIILHLGPYLNFYNYD